MSEMIYCLTVPGRELTPIPRDAPATTKEGIVVSVKLNGRKQEKSVKAHQGTGDEHLYLASRSNLAIHC